MSSSLICGRGNSLKYYENLLNEKFDFIYLVNAFDKFIIANPELNNFFQKKIKEGSKIIQLVNIEMTGINREIIKSLKIKEFQTTRLKYTNENVWWRDKIDTLRFKKSLDIVIDYQPEIIEPYMHLIENSLGVAILNAILVKKVDNIKIIGCDFYESDYYLSHRSLDWASCSTKQTQDRLKKGIDKLVKLFHNINFKIITFSSYENKLSNCKVKRLQK